MVGLGFDTPEWVSVEHLLDLLVIGRLGGDLLEALRTGSDFLPPEAEFLSVLFADRSDFLSAIRAAFLRRGVIV